MSYIYICIYSFCCWFSDSHIIHFLVRFCNSAVLKKRVGSKFISTPLIELRNCIFIYCKNLFHLRKSQHIDGIYPKQMVPSTILSDSNLSIFDSINKSFICFTRVKLVRLPLLFRSSIIIMIINICCCCFPFCGHQ